jgi:hypothetical protein
MYKRCRICGAEKPADAFYRASGTADGYRGVCKACNLAARARRYRKSKGFRERHRPRRRWRLENPGKYAALQRRSKASPRYKRSLRQAHLRRKYGITIEDYEAMLAAQGGECAICGAPEPDGASLHVDDCHDSGDVRGLLCFNCNAGLGMFDHEPGRLARAAAYLRSGR